MTKEVIDDFLSENEQLKQRIKRISQNYSISDFVKATEIIRDYMQNKESENVHGIWGCLYNIRKGYLRLDIESVESRLTNEYLGYLREILMSEEDIDKVFYIVAYHYLTLAKHLGYQLTANRNDNALFPFDWDEMSPYAEDNYKKSGYEKYSELRWQIYKNPSLDINAEDASRKFCMSSGHFRSIYKKLFKISFHL